LLQGQPAAPLDWILDNRFIFTILWLWLLLPRSNKILFLPLAKRPFYLIVKIKTANNLCESIFMDVYSSMIMYYTKVIADEVNYVGVFFFTQLDHNITKKGIMGN
jgi:hypothetical protein